MSPRTSPRANADQRIDHGVTVKDTVNDTVVDELGPLAEQAVQTVRTLIHQTRPAVGALNQPAQAAQLLAVLAELTAMLPQLLDHLQCWLLDQHRHGRLRTDHEQRDDQYAGPVVHVVTAALAHAGDSLGQAGHALQAAHQDTAHLAVADVSDVSDEVTVPEAGWGQR
jgi:hypothetical protein